MPEHLAELLQTSDGRMALGRTLTTKRVEGVGLDRPSFERLAAVMLMALDFCLAQVWPPAARVDGGWPEEVQSGA